LANGTSNFDIATANGNVTVTANGTSTWTFGSDGNLAIPGNIVGLATIDIDNRASGNSADINLYAADDITIQGRDRGAGSTSEGGDINIFAGNSAVDSDSSGGDILIFAGNGGNANVDFAGLGGFITIAGGRGGNASTGVGNYPAEDGGELTLRAGDAGSNNGNILRGADGGFVYIEAGDSTGNTIDGGGIALTTGLGGANALAGNVEINIPSSDLGAGGTWIFDGYGNLTLPTNGSLNLTGGGISQASDEDLLITTFDSDGIVSSSLLMSPGDTLTRLEQWSSQNSESFNTSDWATGVYTNQGGLGAVQFTGAANIVDFVNSVFGATGHIFISVNGGPLLFLDGTGGGATDITFYTPTLPAVNPTTVTSFEYYYSYNSGFEIDYDSNEVNIYANDADITLLTTGQRDISLDSSGDVTIKANSASTWTFGSDGSLTFPIGISIDNSVNPVYPKIIADSDLLFSVQGQGANGSAALAWSIDPNVDSQYAAVGVNRGGGDDLAKVVLTAGNTTATLKVWKFDQTGNLNLPQGGVVYETSIPGGVLTGNTIALKPQGGTSTDQQLLIYPTVIGADANHLHLTSGNLYNTELFLGNDDLYVKLANTGNILINTNDSAGNIAQWTFGTDSVLTFPRDTSNISTDPILNIIGGANPTITSTDASLAGPANLGISALTTIFTGSTGDAIKIYPDDGEISGDASIQIWANAVGNTQYSWTFGDDGNLTLPGNTFDVNYANGTPVSIGGGGANTGNVTFSGETVIGTGTSNTISGLYLAPDPGSLANSLYLRVRGNVIDEPTHIHFDTGNNAYFNQFIGDDLKYIQLANTGNIVINTNDSAGNTAQWTFDTIGSLTLPGGSRLRPLGPNLDIFAGTGSYVNLITSDESSSVGVDGGGGYIVTAGGTWGFSTTGNLTAPGNVSAVGNVTGGNVLTGGLISATGDVSGGNLNVTGNIVDTGALSVITGANGNISLSPNGTGIVTVSSGMSVTGNITGNTAGFAIGYLNIPQVAFTANATIAATDAGKHYYSTLATANALTIANNTSVSWSVGTAITVVNRGSGNIIITQGSGVSLYLAGNSTPANRTVTTYGMATLLNVAANIWMINGTGVS
jgi:hypothetical protein